MKNLIVICLSLVAATCFPLQAFSGDASGSITGTVKDSNEAALDQAVIVIQHWTIEKRRGGSPDSAISIRPDSQGRFSATVTPGIYDVFVSCPFCSPQAKQIELKSGAKAVIVFKMQYSRYVKAIE